MASPITMFTGQWAGNSGPVSAEGEDAGMGRLLDAAFSATGDS